jgi:hypothetical protein
VKGTLHIFTGTAEEALAEYKRVLPDRQAIGLGPQAKILPPNGICVTGGEYAVPLSRESKR